MNYAEVPTDNLLFASTPDPCPTENGTLESVPLLLLEAVLPQRAGCAEDGGVMRNQRFATSMPAMRPLTMQSVVAFEPRRTAPCTPPVASPAA